MSGTMASGYSPEPVFMMANKLSAMQFIKNVRPGLSPVDHCDLRVVTEVNANVLNGLRAFVHFQKFSTKSYMCLQRWVKLKKLRTPKCFQPPIY